mmetsp:Transcript_2398/g.7328  ORF Transcript_2398/g.7328 Transcript_2398/m.7328 type:complete len:227 (-) Transcript_2398:2021-2701(-)
MTCPRSRSTWTLWKRSGRPTTPAPAPSASRSSSTPRSPLALSPPRAAVVPTRWRTAMPSSTFRSGRGMASSVLSPSLMATAARPARSLPTATLPPPSALPWPRTPWPTRRSARRASRPPSSKLTRHSARARRPISRGALPWPLSSGTRTTPTPRTASVCSSPTLVTAVQFSRARTCPFASATTTPRPARPSRSAFVPLAAPSRPRATASSASRATFRSRVPLATLP